MLPEWIAAVHFLTFPVELYACVGLISHKMVAKMQMNTNYSAS